MYDEKVREAWAVGELWAIRKAAPNGLRSMGHLREVREREKRRRWGVDARQQFFGGEAHWSITSFVTSFVTSKVLVMHYQASNGALLAVRACNGLSNPTC